MVFIGKYLRNHVYRFSTDLKHIRKEKIQDKKLSKTKFLLVVVYELLPITVHLTMVVNGRLFAFQ
jgi:hypothetical protein